MFFCIYSGVYVHIIYAISANIFWHLLFSNDGSGRTQRSWDLEIMVQPKSTKSAMCALFFVKSEDSADDNSQRKFQLLPWKKHRIIRKNWFFSNSLEIKYCFIAISILTLWWISSCFILWLYIYYIFCWSCGPIIVVWLTVLLDLGCCSPRPDVCLAVPACWSSVDINFLRRHQGWRLNPGNLGRGRDIRDTPRKQVLRKKDVLLYVCTVCICIMYIFCTCVFITLLCMHISAL